MPSRFDIVNKSGNNPASAIGGKRIPDQMTPKQKFESGLEKLDRIYDTPEFQRKANQFIRDSSTIPEKELNQPMSTISKCPVIPALIVPKEKYK
jgi:hypothetical protein